MTIDEEINDKEKEAINELRKRMSGDMEPEMFEDDYLILRFLRARDLNIDNAEKMLRKHLEWREKSDIKNIMKFEKTEFMEKYVPYVTLCFDKEDCVVRYADLANMDIKGILSSMTFEESLRFAIYETEMDTENLKKQSKKHGRNIDKCVYIYNMDNFTFAKATDKRAINYLICILDIYVNNYPERLKAAYVINASMYFNILFSILKGFLPKTILSKIHVYSDDSYKEELLKVLDADALPAFLGGNKTDPDGNPSCLTFVKYGEPVPESYYLNKPKQSLAKAPDAKKVTLSRAAFHEEKIDVQEAGSYLEWEFETKCRDIGFGLFYEELRDGEEKITEIVPIQRIDTELYPETGTFKCEVSGTYVIVFDNTYSWVRAKEIYYRVKVVKPKDVEYVQTNEQVKD